MPTGAGHVRFCPNVLCRTCTPCINDASYVLQLVMTICSHMVNSAHQRCEFRSIVITDSV
jgi:hypothetical protein